MRDARKATLGDFGVECDTDENRVKCRNCGQPIPENQKARHYREDCPAVETGVDW